MGTETCQLAVVGAGPYGLSTASHLRAVGVEVRTFGRPMEFWERHMPAGMLLRSAWSASHIADPDGRLSLDAYEDKTATRLARPIPLADFIRYGRWYQREAVPEHDERRVERIERASGGLLLTLSDGDRLRARRVVVATGLGDFDHRPPEFRHLPPELASHSSEHRDLGAFAGRRLVVVGTGQSALESAALLAEGGADVELVGRAPLVRWLVYGRASRLPPLVRTLLYPPTDVGPPLLNWIVAVPELFRLVPGGLQPSLAYRCIRPAGADWLRERLQGVPVTTAQRVVEAVPARDGGLAVHLSDGSRRSVDHLLLATGYRVDMARCRLLSADIVAALAVQRGSPRLSRGFESSVPGLYFVGAPAAVSFGPVMRFVAGTMYTARAVRQRVLEQRPPGVARTLRAYARQRKRIGAPAV